jgi:hypothetical protein
MLLGYNKSSHHHRLKIIDFGAPQPTTLRMAPMTLGKDFLRDHEKSA